MSSLPWSWMANSLWKQYLGEHLNEVWMLWDISMKFHASTDGKQELSVSPVTSQIKARKYQIWQWQHELQNDSQ